MKKIRRLVCVLFHLVRSTLMTLTRLIFSLAALKPSRTSKKSPWNGIWPFQEFTIGYRRLTWFRNSAPPLQWNWWQLDSNEQLTFYFSPITYVCAASQRAPSDRNSFLSQKLLYSSVYMNGREMERYENYMLLIRSTRKHQRIDFKISSASRFRRFLPFVSHTRSAYFCLLTSLHSGVASFSPSNEC